MNFSFSQSLPNDSNLKQGLEVPPHLTEKYNYSETIVKSPLRGCVCLLKPYIWFCCRFKDLQPNGKCAYGTIDDLDRINSYLNETLWNSSMIRRNLLNYFIMLRDTMLPEDDCTEDVYTLNEGRLLLMSNPTSKQVQAMLLFSIKEPRATTGAKMSFQDRRVSLLKVPLLHDQLHFLREKMFLKVPCGPGRLDYDNKLKNTCVKIRHQYQKITEDLS